MFGGVLLVFGLLAGVWIWRANRGRAEVRAAVAAETPADARLRVGAVRRQMAEEFGDSVARIQRELQDQRSALRLERRFRGAALQSSPSLRAVQVAAERFSTDGDRLLARTDALGRSLLALADSMVAADQDLQGLSAALEDVLDEWRRDLARYARLDRDAATDLHALATFLLRRQQSFYLEEGRPRFLSREDALDYRQLWDRLSLAAGQEMEWARQVQRKRPAWMAGLPEESRPRFGQPLVQRP